MSHPDCLLRRAVAVGVLCLAGVAGAQTVTLEPAATKLALNPGDTWQFTATVCLPGQIKKADIYVLIDTTPSMNPVIAEVKENASEIVDSLFHTPGLDIRVGMGTYRDFPFDAEPFEHLASPTADAVELVDTIMGLQCGGGGDGSEGQFYALQQIATDGALGFRPDAKRIVVWFGDSPGHDPICPIFVGFGEPAPAITEATCKAALAAAGPGGTSVIAISTPTGYDLGLNDDPLLFAGDYAPFCTPAGLPGQADRVATATHGISTFVTDPKEITHTVLDTVDSLLLSVDLSCEMSNALAPFVQLINPPSYTDVTLPSSPEETVCKTFDVVLSVPPCPRVGKLFPGNFVVRRNGIPMSTKFMTVFAPPCKPMYGLLLAGLQSLAEPMKFKSKDPADNLWLVPMAVWQSPLENMPTVHIPNDPAIDGFRIYLQGAAQYKHAFSKDPFKTSNGLALTIGTGGGAQVFGSEGGLKLWMDETSAPVGGTLHFHCAVNP
jgi:hypothetical protein